MFTSYLAEENYLRREVAALLRYRISIQLPLRNSNSRFDPFIGNFAPAPSERRVIRLFSATVKSMCPKRTMAAR